MCEYVFLYEAFLLLFPISFDGFFSFILGTLGGYDMVGGHISGFFVLLLFVSLFLVSGFSGLKGNDEDDEDDE